ncbi:maltose excess protein 1-like, chloroplastic isoform X2 [Salvia miltiorrhiza]|uniref:maltose excess protein 1-like, chloroplastic isoform X2 n=1 Tax=Salvia miltiorrhiza TaxID=226208 RepID=UPI0025AD0551|nr:maltose excess protein 1-like, chloroplastic isoform X2 [Salvia miltiorrhiza]
MADSLLLKYKVKLQTYGQPHSCPKTPNPELFSRDQLHFRGDINYELHLKKRIISRQSITCSRLKPVSAEPLQVKHKNFEEWDSLTAKFAGAANLPFLLLQLPQIILNYRNLMAGNRSALLAVPWLGMLTGLLGNLSLLSYFIKKGETEAVAIQMLGVVSIYVVILQLAMAEAMPLSHFVVTSIVTATGVVLNLMKHFNLLSTGIWKSWEEFITIAGLSALPQVMWSTFIPFVPNTVLPGIIALLTAVLAVSMARMGKLSKKGINILGSVSGWTATLLFMWMPVAQMWTNLLNPENVKGLSAVTMLLAMIGNGLLIPRALLTRDLMWFTGSTWACVFYGWGNLVCLYCFNSISWEFFLASTLGFLAWIGITFWRDAQVHGHPSSFTSLKDLIFGH